MRGALEGRGIRPQVFFLEAQRRGPDPALQRDAPPPSARRRARASPARSPRSAGCSNPSAREADVVLDTSDLSLRELRERLFAQLATDVRPDQLAIQLISFGFKYGVPLEADLVFDVRFMQNPYYVPELRQLSGLTERCARSCSTSRCASASSSSSSEFLEFAIPAYVAEGKTPADDRHRLHRRLPPLDRHRRGARDVAARARTSGPVAVFHRELERTMNLAALR